MSNLPPGYHLSLETPRIADYLHLREATGLTPRSADSARKGLPNTVFAAVIRHTHGVVAMGRVIGDGGLFYQLVDIAVLPQHQGQGLGKAIVAALMDALSQNLAGEAYVSLIADGDARHLYSQFGFEPVTPKSIGMAQFLRPPGRTEEPR